MEGRRKGGRKGGVGGWDEDEDYDDEKNIKALNINDYTKKRPRSNFEGLQTFGKICLQVNNQAELRKSK